MKTTALQQEVLLNTDAAYLTGLFAPKDPDANPHLLTQREQLEEACWNGSLPDMLPEIFDTADKAVTRYLWQITEGEFFINLTLGEAPAQIESEFSINPYAFLSRQLFS